MSLSLFWREHHTLLSLALGALLTFIIFKIPKLKTPYKIIIILIVLFFLTGLIGVLKFLGLVLIIAAILYGAFVSIWGLGIIAMSWFAVSHGWDLRWWQIFLICAVWGPISMLLNVGIMSIMIFIIKALGVAYERFPAGIKRNLRIHKD